MHFEVKGKYNTPMLIVILMTAFITTFTGSALNLSVPSISSEFHAGAVSVGWIVTGYILASAALSVPFGRFADLYGKRPVFLAGVSIFTVCCFSLHAFSEHRHGHSVQAYPGRRRCHDICNQYSHTRRHIRLKNAERCSVFLQHSISWPVARPVGGFLNAQFSWRSIFIATTVYDIIMTMIVIFRFSSRLSQDSKSAV